MQAKQKQAELLSPGLMEWVHAVGQTGDKRTLPKPDNRQYILFLEQVWQYLQTVCSVGEVIRQDFK